MTTAKKQIWCLGAALLIAEAALPAVAGPGVAAPSPTSNDSIRSLIAELSDASFAKRTEATRQLCAAGSAAKPLLEAAVVGDDAETALRAKAVLAVLDGLLLSGVEVRLTFSKSEAAWDKPVDLIIKLTNRSNYPARIPFLSGTNQGDARSADAVQVGNMIDAADYLRVLDQAGTAIDLRVDEISADPAVVAAVEARLDDQASAVLDAGGQRTIVISEFNRGWARYPLLDAGTYTVLFDYVPAWDDPVLATRKVGQVVSNVATLAVTRAAPPAVSRSGQAVSLQLERVGDELVSHLINHTDQPMRINMNFGPAPPFAEGRWVIGVQRTKQEHHDIPVAAEFGTSWHDFRSDRLVVAEPGESKVMARLSIDELHRHLVDTGIDRKTDSWSIYFGYANLCDRHWQKRQGAALVGNPKAPAVFQKLLPRHILATRQTSNRFTTDDLKPGL